MANKIDAIYLKAHHEPPLHFCRTDGGDHLHIQWMWKPVTRTCLRRRHARQAVPLGKGTGPPCSPGFVRDVDIECCAGDPYSRVSGLFHYPLTP